MYIDPSRVSDVTIPNDSISSSTLTLTEITITNGVLSHYTVFYLPVRGPYGLIMTSNRRRRQPAQDGELTMNFNGTIGILTNLNGSVTYRIQVAAVVMLNGEEHIGEEHIGDQSAVMETTTLKRGEQFHIILCL